MKKRSSTLRRTRGSHTVSAGARLESHIQDSCLQMLMPLAGILLRAGIGAGELSDLCRRAYIQMAAGELASPHRRPNISRIAVATGLTRQEVARVLSASRSPRRSGLKQLQRANRVLAGWYEDSRFTNATGEPKPLAIRGSGPTFENLVRTYGGDVPPRAVLDELRRAAAVRVTHGGSIVPKRRFVEYGAKSQKALQHVSHKLRLLAETLSHNLNYPTATLFEDVALNDHLRAEHYPIAVQRLSASARRFLSATKQYLDRDERQMSRSRRASKPMRLGVGIYLFGKSP